MHGGIHITGAAGAGTSTLGRAVADALRAPLIDSDEAYWFPTDPPYRLARAPVERLALVEAGIAGAARWVLAGSALGWAEPLVPRVRLVVFLDTPTPLRLARLRAREAARFGSAIAPGGARHAEYLAFLDWAAGYEEGNGAGGRQPGRSRARHEAWLAGLPCPVLRLDGARPPGALREAVLAILGDA